MRLHSPLLGAAMDPTEHLSTRRVFNVFVINVFNMSSPEKYASTAPVQASKQRTARQRDSEIARQRDSETVILRYTPPSPQNNTFCQAPLTSLFPLLI